MFTKSLKRSHKRRMQVRFENMVFQRCPSCRCQRSPLTTCPVQIAMTHQGLWKQWLAEYERIELSNADGILAALWPNISQLHNLMPTSRLVRPLVQGNKAMDCSDSSGDYFSKVLRPRSLLAILSCCSGTSTKSFLMNADKATMFLLPMHTMVRYVKIFWPTATLSTLASSTALALHPPPATEPPKDDDCGEQQGTPDGFLVSSCREWRSM